MARSNDAQKYESAALEVLTALHEIQGCARLQQARFHGMPMPGFASLPLKGYNQKGVSASSSAQNLFPFLGRPPERDDQLLPMTHYPF